ncbi:hypothetical protein B0H14DRAFT_2565357 [Mycena olivaceomarginata]|nr:hypothetical protein B0H14DRAFT_2565357 [Mycena olivaceomarginata]
MAPGIEPVPAPVKMLPGLLQPGGTSSLGAGMAPQWHLHGTWGRTSAGTCEDASGTLTIKDELRATRDPHRNRMDPSRIDTVMVGHRPDTVRTVNIRRRKWVKVDPIRTKKDLLQPCITAYSCHRPISIEVTSNPSARAFWLSIGGHRGGQSPACTRARNGVRMDKLGPKDNRPSSERLRSSSFSPVTSSTALSDYASPAVFRSLRPQRYRIILPLMMGEASTEKTGTEYRQANLPGHRVGAPGVLINKQPGYKLLESKPSGVYARIRVGGGNAVVGEWDSEAMVSRHQGSVKVADVPCVHFDPPPTAGEK